MNFFKNQIELTPEQKKVRNKQLLFGVISGILLGLSFPSIPFPFFVFIALIPFLFVVEQRVTLLSLNRFTYVSLFPFSLIALYWVGSWTKEADPFLMASGAALIIFTPVFYFIPVTLYYFSRKVFSRKIALMLFPLYWVSFEHLYSVTDLKFPWLTLGNSLPYFKSFIQIADMVGVYGLSLIVLYINVFLYLLIKEFYEQKKINYGFFTTVLVLFILPLIYGLIRINTYSEPKEKVSIGLIQPNINPWEKWEDGNLTQQIDSYLGLSEQAVKRGAKIIIWPESALPVYLLGGNFPYEVERINQFVSNQQVYLITGMPDINFYFDSTKAPKDAKRTRISNTYYTSYNSILMFSPFTRTVQKYQKNMLVPFGEHVPFVEQIPLLGDFIKWQVGISSWNIGKEQNVFQTTKNKIGGIVCIESIYPDFVTKFVNNDADFIAVVTNDSWYGYSSGPFQHKEISVLRAIENRRSVVRAANGGISCIIDPLGNILEQTKLFSKTFLVGDVPVNHEKTFFTKFPYIIPVLVHFISLITVVMFIIIRIKNRLKKS